MTLENPSDHDHPAPHADAQADQQASETKPDMPPAIGMTKPETPPPSKKNSQSQHKEKHWLDYLEAVLGGIGLVVLVVYTIYTALMYSANKNAADAAKSAADTAQETLAQSIDAFRIDERAWIEIEPIKPQLLTREDAKFSATFTCNIFPRNVGKTVATDIVVKAQDQNSAEEFGSNRSEMNSVQDKLLRGEFTEMGTGKPIVIPSNPVPKVLAPGTTSTAPFRLKCQAPQVFPNGSQWPHFLVGRIDYCDQFRIRHWKKFCCFVVNARGEIWNCQEGNDEDRNSETPTEKTICPVTAP